MIRAASHEGQGAIAVAVSGGVDSLCALLLLRDAGHDVLALHGRFLPQAGTDPAIAELARICASLDIPFVDVPLERIFAKKVLEPFVRDWDAGLVPNPCAICNQAIKFGALLAAARRHGATRLATGHYARLAQSIAGGYPALAMAGDRAKDQSYFLSLCPPARLARALFPLAELRKDQCRQIVAAHGLHPPAPEESQDICFIKNCDYRAFLNSQRLSLGLPAPAPGPILLRDADGSLRQIGSHSGLCHYTVGQRKGLNLPFAHPLYVTGKNLASNALLVAARAQTAMRACVARSARIHLPPDRWPATVYARLRHHGPLLPATASCEGHRLRIELAQTAWPTSPGQIATLYDSSGIVLAGGILEEIL